MLVSRIYNDVTFRTDFNDKYNIAHVFSGIEGTVLRRNDHVDYRASTLFAKDKETLPQSILLCTPGDEDPPLVINGHFIGGGHGEPCLVIVYAPRHGKTIADIGAKYKDETGLTFTLVYVTNSDTLLFCSENVGESVNKYIFKREIQGKLTYVDNGENTSDVVPEETLSPWSGEIYLPAANRILEKKVVTYTDGKAKTFLTAPIECDYAEIIERYQIVNPATVVEDLAKSRPQGGYRSMPDLSKFGQPMVDISYIFRINPDGTVLVEFEVDKLMDVKLDRFMGVMYQEKIDAFGGGIYRYLSKLKPFTTPEGTFDFSSPYPLRGSAYPQNYSPTTDDLIDKNNPFDRIVDYFRDKDGKDKLGFACGYLPVYDGLPEIRKDLVSSMIHIYQSRKAYPNFASSVPVNHFKGVAYKKFFDTENRSSIYKLDYEGKKYIYFDIFEDNELTYKTDGKVTLFEKDNVDCKINDGVITVKGNKGHATFIEE